VIETVVMPSETRPGVAARNVIIVIAGAALMTLAAKVQIPLWPVPMTLHTLAVMAFAVAFGPRLAVSIFLAYLAAGVPVCRSFRARLNVASALPIWSAQQGAILRATLSLAGWWACWRQARARSGDSARC
jgi:BioY family